ncbi:hypothetical protein BJV82DRAFT_582548 [Fennellomyces sp. T-0311]|nr:hypothetical protein BJV82DRAFT_582548 [Fennellomyces sp. T-0311]
MLLSSHPLISPFERVSKPPQPRQDKLCTSSTATREYTQLEQNLWQGSLSAAVQLATGENPYHDTDTGKCYQCDRVAQYYLIGLQKTMQNNEQELGCTADLLELVWQMCQMVLEHVENEYPVGDWFVPVTQNLWALAKRLKDEEKRPDYHAVMLPSMVPEQEEKCDSQETYRRAIRITIYNCRALVYQQHSHDIDKAVVYFRKCVAVRLPPALEAQKLLRQSAIAALDTLAQHYVAKSRSASISTTSSGASSSSSSSSLCGNCGVEKRSMPVCARCKTKTYCSSRCLLAHKLAHEKECKGRKH